MASQSHETLSGTRSAATPGSSPDQPGSQLVSVVICVYNCRPYLRFAVESILAQDYANLEVLVVDDGSTDDSLETLRDVSDSRLVLLRQPHSGKSVALNYALRVMRGAFYAVQDADDTSDPSRIRLQLDYMLQNPDVAVVMCGHRLLIGDRFCAPRLRYRGREWCWREVRAMRMPAMDPTAMYRMSAVRGIEYSPDLLTAQGYDYLLRVAERMPVVVLAECLYTYRAHDASTTRANAARRLMFVDIVRKRAAARRGVHLAPILQPLSQVPDSGNSARDNNLQAQFIESVLDLRRLRRRFTAVRTGLDCISLHPLDPRYYKAFLYSLLPASLVSCVRSDMAPSDNAAFLDDDRPGSMPPLMAQLGDYDSWHRDDVLVLVPTTARRVLSCGCGSGLTEEALVRRGVQVCGIEVNETSAAAARHRGVRVVASDAERESLPLDAGTFDCLIYADVLEHLRDPLTLLRSQMQLLQPGGSVILSVPNYRNYSVLWQLVVRGRVDHGDSGILDKTHMKLTTRKLCVQWLRDCGASVEHVRYKMNRRRTQLLSLFTLGVLDEWLAMQVLVVGKKPGRDALLIGTPSCDLSGRSTCSAPGHQS